MQLSQETATFIIVALQASGTIGAIIYGIIRIERRFTRLEINMRWMRRQCPRCNEK